MFAEVIELGRESIVVPFDTSEYDTDFDFPRRSIERLVEDSVVTWMLRGDGMVVGSISRAAGEPDRTQAKFAIMASESNWYQAKCWVNVELTDSMIAPEIYPSLVIRKFNEPPSWYLTFLVGMTSAFARRTIA